MQNNIIIEFFYSNSFKFETKKRIIDFVSSLEDDDGNSKSNVRTE